MLNKLLIPCNNNICKCYNNFQLINSYNKFKLVSFEFYKNCYFYNKYHKEIYKNKDKIDKQICKNNEFYKKLKKKL